MSRIRKVQKAFIFLFIFVLLIYFIDRGVYIGINGMRAIKLLSETLYEDIKQAGQPISSFELKNEKDEISNFIVIFNCSPL